MKSDSERSLDSLNTKRVSRLNLNKRGNANKEISDTKNDLAEIPKKESKSEKNTTPRRRRHHRIIYHSPNKNKIITTNKENIKVDLIKYAKQYNPKALFELSRLINRTDIATNPLGEDIELLSYILYNGKCFKCLICNVSSKYAVTMQENHICSLKHKQNVSRLKKRPYYDRTLKESICDKLLSDSSFKKFFNKLFSFEVNEKTVSDYMKIGYASKETLLCEPEKMLINHHSERNILINDTLFESYFGEEFLKSVSGMKCDICNIFMSDSKIDSVAKHLSGEIHQENFKNYIIRNPGYFPGLNRSLSNKYSVVNKDRVILSELNNQIEIPIEFTKNVKVNNDINDIWETSTSTAIDTEAESNVNSDKVVSKSELDIIEYNSDKI